MSTNPEYSHGKLILSPSSSRVRQEDLRTHIGLNSREVLSQALRAELIQEFGVEEVESHISSMPPQYWTRVDQESLRWHLRTLHSLFLQIAEAHTMTTSPVMRWRDLREQGIKELAICSWDRPGLLMNIAGALSRAGFNILRADVYTRADHLALDIFQVQELNGDRETSEIRLRYAARLLAAAMAEPHSTLEDAVSSPAVEDQLGVDDLQNVIVDNRASKEWTVLRIDAADRVGLLYRLLQACVACGIDVKQATIETAGNRARDVFCITDAEGRMIEDPAYIESCREALCRAISGHVQFAPAVWGVDPLNLVEPRA